jgi:2-methylisocitrate lyase-like PEP mutase family enzyme
VDRASHYTESGADLTFVEAPEGIDEMRRIPQLLKAPQVANMVIGGKTPILDVADLSAMGFAIALYANAALQGAILGMQNVLRELKQRGRLDENSQLISFVERQRLVQKPMCDEWERKYSSGDKSR